MPVFRVLAHTLEGGDGLDRNVVIRTFGVESPHIFVKWEVRIGEIKFHCEEELAFGLQSANKEMLSEECEGTYV